MQDGAVVHGWHGIAVVFSAPKRAAAVSHMHTRIDMGKGRHDIRVTVLVGKHDDFIACVLTDT